MQLKYYILPSNKAKIEKMYYCLKFEMCKGLYILVKTNERRYLRNKNLHTI